MALAIFLMIEMAIAVTGVSSSFFQFHNLGEAPSHRTLVGTIKYSPKMNSPVDCALICTQGNDDCKSFLWDEASKTCTTPSNGDMSGLTNPLPVFGPSALYSRQFHCNTDLGYQLRRYGLTVLCLLFKNDRHSYAQAKTECGRLDGHLVKANTRDKVQIVMELYKDDIQGALKDDHIGMGLDDDALPDTFVWWDGQVMTSKEGELFCANEPGGYGSWGTIWYRLGCIDDVFDVRRDVYVCEMTS